MRFYRFNKQVGNRFRTYSKCYRVIRYNVWNFGGKNKIFRIRDATSSLTENIVTLLKRLTNSVIFRWFTSYTNRFTGYGNSYILTEKFNTFTGYKTLCRVMNVNLLSVNPIKWSNTLKQFVDNLLTNYLSLFDHFVLLKGKLYEPLMIDLTSTSRNIKIR